MFNLKKYVLAAAVLAAIPVSSAMASDNQTYAVLHPSEPAIAPGMARIYIYREGGILGAAVQPSIQINGEETGGRSKPGDYFYVDRPVGTYEISAETEKKESASLTVADGQSYYVRTHITMGLFIGHAQVTIEDPAFAQKDIADCDWHMSTPPAAAQVAATPAPADAAPTPATTSATTSAAAPAATATPAAAPAASIPSN